ncbi:hypothetical protein BH11BAC2_BH11BAC2_12590 [soil metagenome]
MKTIITFSILLLLAVSTTKAQTTAMQFSGLDCNGNNVDLFADLDAGKAVILHFFMANCGSCPPPAQKIQAMANHINATHPGMVKGYAFPFTNGTTCSYSSNWVASNNLSALYAPMDSGSTQVAYYGGFGMPTVVVLGGADHRILFSTQSFSTSDTTLMRDSILSLLTATGINETQEAKNSFQVYPNPANEKVNISLNVKERSAVKIELTDISGKVILVILNDQKIGIINQEFNSSVLANGVYLIKLTVNGSITTEKLNVAH